MQQICGACATNRSDSKTKLPPSDSPLTLLLLSSHCCPSSALHAFILLPCVINKNNRQHTAPPPGRLFKPHIVAAFAAAWRDELTIFIFFLFLLLLLLLLLIFLFSIIFFNCRLARMAPARAELRCDAIFVSTRYKRSFWCLSIPSQYGSGSGVVWSLEGAWRKLDG